MRPGRLPRCGFGRAGPNGGCSGRAALYPAHNGQGDFQRAVERGAGGNARQQCGSGGSRGGAGGQGGYAALYELRRPQGGNRLAAKLPTVQWS